jgi:DNA-binding transcriptional LysR family regulator
MTLEQIEYFVTAVEQGSFSAAGDAMFVSHSSVSRGVSVLETELDVQLLTRGQRRLSCTEAGEVFYRQGKALLQQASELKASVSPFRAHQKLQLCSIGVYAPRFFDLCREFQQLHPEVEVVIQQEEQLAAVEALRSGGSDLSLTFSYSIPSDGSYETLVLERGHFCALVSPQHEWAERPYLTVEELSTRQDILGGNPFRPDRDRRRDVLGDIQSILLRIKTGNGVTVLPEHTAAEFGHGCVQIPICGGPTEYQLMLVWRRENPARSLASALDFFRARLLPDAPAPQAL